MRSIIYPKQFALILVTFLFISLHTVQAGEGMWLPLLLQSLNESEMKSMGMKMKAEDIYSINKGSLKDAVVLFNGNCTGEVVSSQGLLLTNHHCGYSAIQDRSTLEHNYLIDGFWAKNKNEEMPNPGMYVTFIVRMEDVTQQILEGMDGIYGSKNQQAIIDQNFAKLKETVVKESYQDVMIRPFFEGNQYYMFITESYSDIRYVGSPPSSIGKFGADTDNWVWPRHTGDFSVYRIYAGPDNTPAQYSPDNKPFQPRHFFPISLDGIAAGDFTLIFGFPGKTNEYLPSYAISQTINEIDPARIGVRTISLGIMDKYMRTDEATQLDYSVKYAGLANAWKKWVGEVQGLKLKNVVVVKQKQESDFTQKLAANSEYQAAYGNILPQMSTLYAELDPIIKSRTLLAEVLGGSNIELFKVASWCDRLTKAYIENGEKGFQETIKKLSPAIDAFYKEYHPDIDREIYNALLDYLVKELPPAYVPDQILPSQDHGASNLGFKQVTDIMALTSLSKKENFLALLQQGGETFVYRLDNDKGYNVYSNLKRVLDFQISPKYLSITEQLNALQKTYMKALMEVYTDKKFWPDANSTLRVGYGQVENYTPKDGMTYNIQTYLDGVMEKYIPGDYEFDVDPKLIELYKNKDYGPYGENGKMPVCFIASNHTTGGNSGSPAIDAKGNLIGINFDRVWEGTMSDLYYDPSICRNIMVDIRYVLFVIDKYAGATNLIQELKLVHPKGNKKTKKK